MSWSASARDEAAPLLGRLEEQSLLTSLLDDVAARGQALVVRGEPGIGKSRLLSMCERTARERGMAVLSTTGVQSEANLPFAGLHQLLRPVRGRASGLRDVQRAALDAAFGLTDEAAPEHFRIAMAALDLVSEAASDAPVLLVVDDAQWLDPPTSDVLAFVARRIESDPIVLLAAIRDGYPSALGDAGLPELRLAGLDDATAGALLDVSAPGLPLASRSRVLREAAGNPLALLELPAMSGEREDEQGLPGGLPLSDRLERAFAARVSDLPDATRLVLLVAALNDSDALSEILAAGAARSSEQIWTLTSWRLPPRRASSRSICRRFAFGIRSCVPQSRRARRWRSVGVLMRHWRLCWQINPTAVHGTVRHCRPVNTRTSRSISKLPENGRGSAARSPWR